MTEKLPTSRRLRRVLGELGYWEKWLLLSLVVASLAAVAVAFTTLKSLNEAGERIAELNKQAEQLRNDNLKLEAKIAPRSLKNEFFEALSGQPKAPVGILYVRDASDGFDLSLQIYGMLRNAGWTVAYPEAIELPLDNTGPSSVFVKGALTGVTIVAGEGLGIRWGTTDPSSGTPVGTLVKAFETSLQSVTVNPDSSLPIGTIRVVVAPRP